MWHICIKPPYKFIKYLACMSYMLNFLNIFLSDTSLAITCEVDISGGCVLAHVCKNDKSVCPFSIMAVIYLKCGIHICLVMYVKYVYIDTEVDLIRKKN